MKKAILIALVMMVTAMTANAQEKKTESKVKHLTYNEFLKKVWDFEKNPTTFEYKGKLPAVIDFYADWCGPCRRVAPIMEKMAEDYEGRLLVYKVNVDEETRLAHVFNVKGLPVVYYIPASGSSIKRQDGLPSEESLRTIIEQELLDQPKQEE